MNPFDIISSINKKQYSEQGEEFEKAYSPFLINRALAAFPDTVLFAAEVDQFSFLDKKLQYDFYFYGTSKKSRFEKWQKADKKSEQEDLVMQFTGCNRSVAKQYIRVLDKVDDTWAVDAKERASTGGKTK